MLLLDNSKNFVVILEKYAWDIYGARMIGLTSWEETCLSNPKNEMFVVCMVGLYSSMMNYSVPSIGDRLMDPKQTQFLAHSPAEEEGFDYMITKTNVNLQVWKSSYTDLRIDKWEFFKDLMMVRFTVDVTFLTWVWRLYYL